MDPDRTKGAAKRAKGAMKESAGRLMGDSKTQAEGKSEKLKGRVQNTIGGIKDGMRDNKRR